MQFNIYVYEVLLSDLQSHCLFQTLINRVETCKTRVHFKMKNSKHC